MSKYIFRLRRGWKYDSDPATGEPRDDWKTYEEQQGHTLPQEGELVLEYDNDVPRLKIGDGKSEFSELEYMSIDSFILPKQPTKIDLSSEWTAVEGVLDTYEQDVTSQLTDLVTERSKIDLQPTPNQLRVFHEKNVAFTTINESGTVKVYAVGTKPEVGYEDIPITITEVVCEGEEQIIGDTTATPNPQPDWNQTDETKADFIKNKPNTLEEAKAYTDQEVKTVKDYTDEEVAKYSLKIEVTETEGGHTVKITNESGEQSFDVTDGATPTIEVSEDNFWIINGEKTEYKAVGADGKDGATPVRGEDYWTEEDKNEIKAYVDEAILGGKW